MKTTKQVKPDHTNQTKEELLEVIEELNDEIEALQDELDIQNDTAIGLEDEVRDSGSQLEELKQQIEDLKEQFPAISTLKDRLKLDFIVEHFDKLKIEDLEYLLERNGVTH